MTGITRRSLPTRVALALVWVFVFTLPLTQATEFPYIGVISNVAAVASMIAGAAAMAARRRVRLPGTVHMLMAGFILWSAITLCWSIAPELTVQRIMTYLQFFLLVILIWELCEQEEDVLRTLSAFVLGTIVPAASTLKAFLPGQQILYQRAGTAGFDANILAFMLALSLPAAYYLILRENSPLVAFYRMQMGFAVCAILLTGSAATMIAMAVGLSLVCWTLHVVPLHTRNRAFTLVVVVALAAILLLPAALWQHISEDSRTGAFTFTTVIQNGVETVQSTPIGGFGAGSMAPAGSHSPAGARSSFTMFSETGVVGVVSFVAMLGVLFLSAEDQPGITKAFWLTVLGVWTVGACALNWESLQPAWLLFGLLAAHSGCLKQQAADKLEREQQQNYYVKDGAEVWS